MGLGQETVSNDVAGVVMFEVARQVMIVESISGHEISLGLHACAKLFVVKPDRVLMGEAPVDLERPISRIVDQR
jgi:hypothetical protein